MKIGMLFKVSGQVQGVGFRMATLDIARRYQLTGWVRNGQDGNTVNVKAFGHPDNMALLAAWLRDGPKHANVSQVSSVPVSIEDLNDFSIKA